MNTIIWTHSLEILFSACNLRLLVSLCPLWLILNTVISTICFLWALLNTDGLYVPKYLISWCSFFFFFLPVLLVYGLITTAGESRNVFRRDGWQIKERSSITQRWNIKIQHLTGWFDENLVDLSPINPIGAMSSPPPSSKHQDMKGF